MSAEDDLLKRALTPGYEGPALCIVCRDRPSGEADTCGDPKCIKRFLREWTTYGGGTDGGA